MQTRSEEALVAYLDGEIDTAERRDVEARYRSGALFDLLTLA